ncbi:hypothetical protein OOU_Y34scaffold00960g4 [Pyricularia oryzae Y34]|uniref:Uncharacterized protein n=1 Tax=Pyricularia oryzae (strain Y34) TaxID=1143189 RepID=A0AA97NNG4_PYRO3|nr:hypothetical protein OOU_Y34scaffold00960g4 [Pyricularia oryzae Y34]
MSSSGSNCRDHSGSGGSSSGWDQILSQASAIGIIYRDFPALSVCNLTLTPVPEHIVAVTLCFAFCSGSQLPIRSNRCNSLMTTYAVLVSADCWPGQI